MKEVLDLFMDENDEAALKKLYELTQDPFVNLALKWLDEYEDQLKNSYLDVPYMYADLIDTIWQKYELYKIKEV